MLTYLTYKVLLLCCGYLYPGFESFKAVKNKDVQGYVRYMMYWITLSIWLFLETFADIILGFWFPFYYELKILFLIWLISPQTRGGSFLYRKVIHRLALKHEREIDTFVDNLKDQTSTLLIDWIGRGLRTCADIIMTAAFRARAGEFFITLRDLSRPRSSRVDRQRSNLNLWPNYRHPIDHEVRQYRSDDQVDSGQGREEDSFEEEFSLSDQMGSQDQRPPPAPVINLTKRINRRDAQGTSSSTATARSTRGGGVGGVKSKKGSKMVRSVDAISADEEETDEIGEEEEETGHPRRLPKSKSNPNVAHAPSDDDGEEDDIMDTSDVHAPTRTSKRTKRVVRETGTNTTGSLPRIRAPQKGRSRKVSTKEA